MPLGTMSIIGDGVMLLVSGGPEDCLLAETGIDTNAKIAFKKI
jgi:hypothetical protein